MGLLISDGEQSKEFAADGKTPSQTAVDAARLVKETDVTVFAWGFARAKKETLIQIATDSSKAILEDDVGQLSGYLEGLNPFPAPGDGRTPPTRLSL